MTKNPLSESFFNNALKHAFLLCKIQHLRVTEFKNCFVIGKVIKEDTINKYHINIFGILEEDKLGSMILKICR